MADELFPWSDDFSVGNSVIDEQHKELVKMTNEFYAVSRMGGFLAKVQFLKTIQGAVKYVNTHFSTEEEIMSRVKYPEFNVHKKQHEDFVAAVTEQIRMFEHEDNPSPSDFIKFLSDWIAQHIADSDKKYVPYIAKLKR